MHNVRPANKEIRELVNVIVAAMPRFGEGHPLRLNLSKDYHALMVFLTGARIINIKELTLFLSERWERIRKSRLLHYTTRLSEGALLNQKQIDAIENINRLYRALALRLAEMKRDEMHLDPTMYEKNYQRLHREARKNIFRRQKQDEAEKRALSIIRSRKSLAEKKAQALKVFASESLAEIIADAEDISGGLRAAISRNILAKLTQFEHANKNRKAWNKNAEYDVEKVKINLSQQEIDAIECRAKQEVVQSLEEERSQICVYQLLMPSIKNKTTLQELALDRMRFFELMLDESEEYLLSRAELVDNILLRNNRNHPYSKANRELTDNEMLVLREGPRERDALDAYESQQARVEGYVTTRSLRKIKKFIEAIMLSRGGVRYYSMEEEARTAIAIAKFRTYLDTISPEERRYIMNYNIRRNDGKAANSTFHSVLEARLSNQVCSYDCGVWFCKFLYDHQPDVKFSWWTIGSEVKAYIRIFAQDKYKPFDPMEHVRDIKPTYLTYPREKIPGIKGFIQRNWKNALFYGGLVLAASAAVGAIMMTCGVATPAVATVGAGILLACGASSTTVATALGFGVLAIAASIAATVISSVVSEIFASKTIVRKVYTNNSESKQSGMKTKDIRNSIGAPRTKGEILLEEERSPPAKNKHPSDAPPPMERVARIEFRRAFAP